MPLKNRRQAREAALRALYESELGKISVQASLEHIDAYMELPEELRAFAFEVATGVFREKSPIDRMIQAKLVDYDLKRVAVVDRNLLRLAVYELYHCPDVPPRVTLDEAIELSKKYSTAESGKFVNGVLAAILRDSPKQDWTPALGAEESEEAAPPEPEPELVEINEDAPEVLEAARVGKWKLRAEEPEE